MISVLGCGGHARALAGVLKALRLPCTMTDDEPQGTVTVVGVGDIERRMALYDRYRPWLNVVHPSAVLLSDIDPCGAVQIMPGVTVQAGVSIGRNVLLNTRASIDHDCVIGDHCHIAPGAVLCGTVTLGECCFIGAGAVVVQNVTLPSWSFVPANALVAGNGDIRCSRPA